LIPFRSESGQSEVSAIDIVASFQDAGLTEEQQDELRQTLTDEIMETGLREDDEPNGRGLLLEELIDKLGHL
jgi:hypothetical protein